MPRAFMVIVDRELVDKVTPGNRVKLVGDLRIIDNTGSTQIGRGKQIQKMYI
jgi:DNA replicative helicase MCM subunit Mcm2 (Cdc46/Mcm family)